MRILGAFVTACLLAFLVLWLGARVNILVSQPDRDHNDFTVGRKMDLCGYAVDYRHEASGYVLDDWQGERCEDLSELDVCLLECLSQAGTVAIGEACYDRCIER